MRQVETGRLLLLPVSMDYVEQMFNGPTDEIRRYIGIYSPKSIDEDVQFVSRSLEKLKEGTDYGLSRAGSYPLDHCKLGAEHESVLTCAGKGLC